MSIVFFEPKEPLEIGKKLIHCPSCGTNWMIPKEQRLPIRCPFCGHVEGLLSIQD